MFSIIKNKSIEELNYQYELKEQKKQTHQVERNQIREWSRIFEFTIDVNIEFLIPMEVKFVPCST